jgi:hypothetical protein
LRLLGQTHPAAVAGNPIGGDAVENRVQGDSYRPEGEEELEERKGKQKKAPEKDIQAEENG